MLLKVISAISMSSLFDFRYPTMTFLQLLKLWSDYSFLTLLYSMCVISNVFASAYIIPVLSFIPKFFVPESRRASTQFHRKGSVTLTLERGYDITLDLALK